MEKWKEIPTTKGFYYASSLGRIKSFRRKTPRILKQTESKIRGKAGYLNVEIFGVTNNTHRLIAHAFIPNPNNLPQVNHIDGNKKNNKPENLEWCSNEENHIKAGKMGLKARGEKQGLSKLKVKDIIEIRMMLSKNHYSQTEIAEVFNVSKATITAIKKRKTWKHIN